MYSHYPVDICHCQTTAVLQGNVLLVDDFVFMSSSVYDMSDLVNMNFSYGQTTAKSQLMSAIVNQLLLCSKQFVSVMRIVSI